MLRKLIPSLLVLLVLGLVGLLVGCSQTGVEDSSTESEVEDSSTESEVEDSDENPVEFELKFSTFLQENEKNSIVAQHWIDLVEERTEGRVKITPYWGATFASPMEHPSLISSGALELAMFPPNIFVAEMPFNSIVCYNISSGFSREEIIEASQKLMFDIPETAKIIEEEQKRINIKFLTPQILGTTGMISKNQFDSLSDTKGWRVTAEGGNEKLWEELGLVPVYVDAVDLYESLSRGVVDAVHLLTVPIVQMKIHEIGKYYREWDNQFMIGLPISVNQSVWESLPADIQEIFLEASKECSMYSIELDTEAVEAAWKTMEEAGLDVDYFTKEDTAKKVNIDKDITLNGTWMECAENLGYGSEAEILLETWEELTRP